MSLGRKCNYGFCRFPLDFTCAIRDHGTGVTNPHPTCRRSLVVNKSKCIKLAIILYREVFFASIMYAFHYACAHDFYLNINEKISLKVQTAMKITHK